jgi:hypothetical protein
MTKQEAYEAFQRADDIWQIALEFKWGVRAGDMRYTDEARGEEGSDLRKAYDDRAAAQAAWNAACDAERAA